MRSPIVKIEFIPPNVPDYEGVIRVSVSNDAMEHLDTTHWPLSFRVLSNSNRVVWNTDLHPSMWSAYAFITYTHAEVVSAQGIKLAEWKWDTFLHGDFAHQAFYAWALRHRGARGIAIGTHDGTSGEWVGPVMDGLLSGVLVEPSAKQHQQLAHLYSSRFNVTLSKRVVTPEGGEVEFFEAGEGHTNSVNPDHVKKYLPHQLLHSFKTSSCTLREILDGYSIGNGIWWMHLDVEDLDDKLLLSFDHSNINLPDCLIFEHENLSRERYDTVLEWCRERNYSTHASGRNTICFRN
jgi:hypothetical protein